MEVIFTDSSVLLVILAVIALLLFIKLIKGVIRLALVVMLVGLGFWYSSKFL
ncbi:MAG: hypothetical protein ACOY4I_12675 [Bacillota bacterium]